MSTVSSFDRVKIVLVGTSHPGNIGSAARAMKVMGFSRLALVAPRCEVTDESYALATKATEIIDGIEVFQTLDDALADVTVAFGASARIRGFDWQIEPPRSAAQRSAQVLGDQTEASVAWVFGREDSGLSNDELSKCQFLMHIPTNPDYASLNVASAVQIACYEQRLALLDHRESSDSEELASRHQYESLVSHFEQVMTHSGFHDPEKPMLTMMKLRHLLNKSSLSRAEVSLLRGFLSSIQPYDKADSHE